MAEEERRPLGREAPFPQEMQGVWVADEEPTHELIVDGSEIRMGRSSIDYVEKTIARPDAGVLLMTIEVTDAIGIGDFIQIAIEGGRRMAAFSDNFATLFVRPGSA